MYKWFFDWQDIKKLKKVNKNEKLNNEGKREEDDDDSLKDDNELNEISEEKLNREK